VAAGRGKRERVLKAAVAKARRFLKRPEVIAVGIGQRQTSGRWLAGRPGIVVKVDWKLGQAGLRRRKRHPLPTSITVVVDGASHRVLVDVQETRGELVGRLQGLVGGCVTAGATVRGSVSAIVSVGAETCVLVSGHVAGSGGVRLNTGGLDGTTRDPIFSSRLDHCVLDTDSALPHGAVMLVDALPLLGIAPIWSVGTDTVAYFHRASTGARVATVIRHFDMTAPFAYPWGTVQMKGLIVTDGVTVDGDSGALLYDNGFRAIGTLIGQFGGESYFIPCETAFNSLGLLLSA